MRTKDDATKLDCVLSLRMGGAKCGTIGLEMKRRGTAPQKPVRFVSPKKQSHNAHHPTLAATSNKPEMITMGMMDQLLAHHDTLDYDSDEDDYSCASSASYNSLTFGDDTYESDDDSSSICSSSSSSTIQSNNSHESSDEETVHSDISTSGRLEANEETKSSPPSSCKGRTRRVRFAYFEEVIEIPHHSEYSDEEFYSMFMDRQEASQIRRECQRLVRLMENQRRNSQGKKCRHFRELTKRHELSEMCMRGLEKHTAEMNSELRATQDMLYSAVYKIQDLALPPGMIDKDHMIAEMCQRITCKHSIAARKLAIHDRSYVLGASKRQGRPA